MFDNNLNIEDIKFDKKPSIKDIISYIAEYNSNFFDNDREFCYLFDLIALNNGYTKFTLPSYWSIGREIFRYKENHNISAKEKINQISLSIKLFDLKKFNIKIENSDKKKPTTQKIIETIWNNYNYAFYDDRLLVKVFDCVSINNGVLPNDLPKYWNIIRAAFNYKKDKKIKDNKNYTFHLETDTQENSIPIDYRVLNIQINQLNIKSKLKNKLEEINIFSISDILNSDLINTKVNSTQRAELYKALDEYNIKPYFKYVPTIITLPNIYFKKIENIFDKEITDLLKKYKIRNIGILANIFPDVLFNDEKAMENPDILKNIETITEKLSTLGIKNCPIKLSVFQKEELTRLTIDELLDINYVSELVESINIELSKLKDSEQNIIIKRFGLVNNEKMTLAAIGEEYAVSRERIRQREKKIIKTLKNKLKTKFNFINESIERIFSKNIYQIVFKNNNKIEEYKELIEEILLDNSLFYIDFNTNLIIKKGITIEDILEDETTSIEIKKKIEKYIYKDYLLLKGIRVKNNKQDILIHFLKIYCRNEIKFQDFQNLYIDFLINNGLNDRDDLLYFDNTLYNKLSTLDCILLSPGKIMRYYDVEKAKELINKINIPNYKNIEISSKKIYIDNLLLMEEYDIKNEYELHNLLKKHLNNSYLDFSRMPMINFGEPNREKQIKDLLYQLAPIKTKDFALAYEDEYGIDTKTFIANHSKYINEYIQDGFYVVNNKELSNEHFVTLKKELTNDIYFKDELEKIYTSLFNNADVKDLNARNIKRLDYTMTSSCIYTDKYNSLWDCIENILLNSDIFNLRDYSKFKTLQTFYQVLSKLKNNLNIIEFDTDRYIHIRKLENAGINKNDLIHYQNTTINYAEDRYFTIYSLKNSGFKYDKLYNLGFEDYFYSSILINNPQIQFKKISNIYLMKKDKKPFDLSDFLIYIMGKLRKIDIYDLCDYLNKEYGFSINRYKIITTIKDCSLYYNQITEKVYIDYDEFYNEL